MATFDTKIDPKFSNRDSRNEFVCKELLTDPKTTSILNLGGGGERHLQKYLNQKTCRVFEIDICGDCDLQINLDQVRKLPFEDNSFEITCAFDVLEHLEQFHLIFEEMVRISSKQILISLPVSSAEFLRSCIKGQKLNRDRNQHGVHSKFYGLPMRPPKDRHRWWLYYQDIIEFFEFFEASNPNYSISFITPKPKSLTKKLLQLVLPPVTFNNLFTPYVFIIINQEASDS